MMSRTKAGFTLLEILVVVLIITILATVVGVNVAHRPGEARQAAAQAQVGNFKTALQMYRMDNGHYPSQRQGLWALCVPSDDDPRPTTFPEGGYLDSPRLPQDPWKHDYVYLLPGPPGFAYEIVSYGADGEPDGEGEDADISSAALE